MSVHRQGNPIAESLIEWLSTPCDHVTFKLCRCLATNKKHNP
ncbi:hypothetical protein P10159_4085 [Citrobacter portucalensis]|nr:hypothetical protein P10159_4085 [Citrobacter portucalensis]